MNWLWIAEQLPSLCKLARLFTRQKPKPQSLLALIVEDNPADAEMLELELRRLHFEVEIAGSAETARGFVRHTAYDLVFIDMRLPGMPGPALLRLLSKDAPNSDVVIVCGDPNDIPAGLGAVVIRKNVTAEAIKDVIRILKL